MINALLAGAKYPTPAMNHTPLTPRTLQVRPPMKPEQHPPASGPEPVRPGAAAAGKKRKLDPPVGDSGAAAAANPVDGVEPKRRKNVGYLQVDKEDEEEGYYLHDEDNVIFSLYVLQSSVCEVLPICICCSPQVKADDDEGDDDDNEDCQKIYFEFDDQDNIDNDIQRIGIAHRVVLCCVVSELLRSF